MLLKQSSNQALRCPAAVFPVKIDAKTMTALSCLKRIPEKQEELQPLSLETSGNLTAEFK